MDPLHPRICISYSPDFEESAEGLAAKYNYLGAKATLNRANSYKSVRHFKGKLCYFVDDALSARIAAKLAKDVSKIQKVSPRLVQVGKPVVDFTIYLVAKPSAANVQPAAGKNLVPCPDCDSFVKRENLERHRKKPHNANKVLKKKKFPKKTKKLRQSLPSAALPKKRLRFVARPGILVPTGAPKVLGWPSFRIKPLRRRKGVTLCRHGCPAPAMHPGGECYDCNAK